MKMPYRFIDHIALADVAFEAIGEDLEEVFKTAAGALLDVTVAERQTVRAKLQKIISIEAESTEMLLFDFLQELIFLKDRDQVLLTARQIEIEAHQDGCHLKAVLTGEQMDDTRHDLVVDVKAVTMHQFKLTKTASGWCARIILDI
jgi:SHS2 domain-containing protein